jgi:ABC-type sugar transport system substrate-binding protein
MLLDVLHQDEENIAQAGPKAIKKALEAGVPVYYIDNALSDGIVKEMPDGKRYLIEVDNGEEVILQTFAPR